MSVFRMKFMRGVTAGATTVAMVFQPQFLVASESVAATQVPVKTVAAQPAALAKVAAAPRDVVLQDQGVLNGRVVDARGLAMPHTPVSLQSGGKEVLRVVSDESGKFQASGLQGGVYQVASTGHQGVYRLWAPRTAPPAAAQGLSIVSQPVDVVRGQYGPGPGNPFSSVGQWIAEHPIITAGAVAAAIAIPIALNDDDETTTPATP